MKLNIAQLLPDAFKAIADRRRCVPTSTHVAIDFRMHDRRGEDTRVSVLGAVDVSLPSMCPHIDARQHSLSHARQTP